MPLVTVSLADPVAARLAAALRLRLPGRHNVSNALIALACAMKLGVAEDAGVGALAARSAVLGAQLNVKINASGLKNRDDASRLLAEAEAVAADAIKAEEDILNIVNGKID